MEIAHDDWLGWTKLRDDPFEVVAGPFYWHDEGGLVCAFDVQSYHLNGAGVVDGGCLATFADAALFVLSRPHWLAASGVTVSLSYQSLRPVFVGQRVAAVARHVEVVADLIYVAALAAVDGVAVLSFNGLIKAY